MTNELDNGNDRQKSIGVFDSGLGGLSIYREIVRELPGEHIVYCADTKHMPYGPRSLTEVRQFVLTLAGHLLSGPIKALVIACNAASAASLKGLRNRFPEFPFIGMEPAVKPAAAESQSGKIGVLATQAAFQGELFESLMNRFAYEVEVIRQPCPGLAEFIENHPLDHPALKPLLEKYISPLISRGVDAIVLGCTHYPLAIEAIKEICGTRVKVIDPSPAIARRTRQVLLDRELLNPKGKGGTDFWVSAEADKFSRLASAILGRKVEAEQKDFGYTVCGLKP